MDFKIDSEDQRFFRQLKKAIERRYVVTTILPFLLAKEGLTAEEIEFAIEEGLGDLVSLRRLRELFPSDAKKGRKPKDIPSHILREIKRLRDEGYGYIKISRIIYRKHGFYISGMTVRKLLLDDIDKLIEEVEKEEKELDRLEQIVNVGRVRQLSLKDIVKLAKGRRNQIALKELSRRLWKLYHQATKMSIFDVL